MNLKAKSLVLSILFLQFLSVDANAKFVDGIIFLAGGEEIECTVELPIRAAAKKLTIKKGADAKPTSISSNDIEMVLLSSNDQQTLLRRTKIRNIKMKGTKLSKQKVWLEVMHLCDNITSYVGIAGYDVDRKGNLFGLSVDGMGGHYLQRTGESEPTEVGYIFAAKQITQKAIDKQRKQKLVRYFENDKKATTYFKSKKRVSESEIIEYIESICEAIKD